MAYFPNASAADGLDRQCSDCPLGMGWNDPRQGQLFEDERQPRQCPVLLVQLTHNYDQCDIPKLQQAMDTLISRDGVCQVREQLKEVRRDAAKSS